MRKEDQSPVHHVHARASEQSRAGCLWHRIGCAELGDETAATGQAPRFAAAPFMPIAEWRARTNMLSITSAMQAARPSRSASPACHAISTQRRNTPFHLLDLSGMRHHWNWFGRSSSCLQNRSGVTRRTASLSALWWQQRHNRCLFPSDTPIRSPNATSQK